MTTAPSAAVLAVDVGGTTVKGAVFGSDGQVVVRGTVGTFDSGGGALGALLGLIESLRTGGESQGVVVGSIGVAVPGVVKDGTVAYASNLDWNELPLREIVQERFELPVVVEHDARAAALAERALLRAATPDLQDFVFVPIGTGISAAIISDGRFVRGSTGGAGEFGHQVVVPGGDICGCGQRGCVESYASAANILRRYRAAGGAGAGSTAEIADRLDADPIAQEVWAEAVHALAAGIAALTSLLDPQVVVIGGGLSAAGDRLLVPLRAETARVLTWRAIPSIVRAGVGVDAGLIGAALAAEPALATVPFVRAAVAALDAPAGALSARR